MAGAGGQLVTTVFCLGGGRTDSADW